MDEFQNTPVTLAQRAFRALEAKQWRAVAQLIDPTALMEFRGMQLIMAEAWEEHSALPSSADADMSDAVEEYANSLQVDHRSPVLDAFARITSLAELSALSPEEFLARWLEGQDLDASQYDDQRVPTATRIVLGEVRENESVSHVVYRKVNDVGRFGITEETGVISSRRTPDGWRLLLNQDISFVGAVRTLVQQADRE